MTKSKQQQRRAIGWDGLRERGIDYSQNHLRRMWDKGLFPKPFNLSKRKIAWWDIEVDQWLAAKSRGA